MGEVRNSYIILVLSPEEKTPLAILRHKLGDTIKMDLKEIETEGVE
jgi:hypothetical protein